jgi:DNA repair exonuclease SbcCD ATPase subunit
MAIQRRNRDALERDILAEEEREDPYAAQIASLRSTVGEIDYGPLNEHNDTLRHQDFLLKLLTGRDSFLRKRLIDRNLAHLNQRLANYLDGLGLPHQVKFLPDLTVDITKRGVDYDYSQLSRGQQGRVTLAMWFAFRDVFEGMNASLNLLFADEVIDNGMDEAGGEAALDVLRKMARERGRCVFLVSHKEGLIGRVNRLLMVRMEDGFTRIDPEGTTEVEALAAA